MSDTGSASHLNAQLSLALSQNMQRLLDRQNEQITRRYAKLVHDGVAMGMVDLAGAGESTATVDFAMTFCEKPVFTFGFELGASSWVQQGQFPIGTAVILSWVTQQFNELTVWTGAKLAMVLTGVAGPSACHYHFMGRALSIPTGTTQQ
jgi:hypothetical protein